MLRDFTFLFCLSFNKEMRSKRMSLSGLCLVLKLILTEERYSISSVSISVISVELFDVACVSTFISSSLFLIIFESFTYFLSSPFPLSFSLSLPCLSSFPLFPLILSPLPSLPSSPLDDV